MSTSSLHSNWIELVSEEGHTYFFNTDTSESSWTRPADFPTEASSTWAAATDVQQDSWSSAPVYETAPVYQVHSELSSYDDGNNNMTTNNAVLAPVYVPPSSRDAASSSSSSSISNPDGSRKTPSSSNKDSTANTPLTIAGKESNPNLSSLTNALPPPEHVVKKVFRSASIALWGDNESNEKAGVTKRSPQSTFQPREYLAFGVVYNPSSRSYSATVQASLKDKSNVFLGAFKSEREAHQNCMQVSPIKWIQGERCNLCSKAFALLVRPHHCRNCGAEVCADCSPAVWPSKMVPSSYHQSEQRVRVCKACVTFMERFRLALLAGNYDEVLAIYSTGNVNLNCPYVIYPGGW